MFNIFPDAHLPAVGAVEVCETVGQPLHLAVALQGDGGLEVALRHIQDDVILLVVFLYFHIFLNVMPFGQKLSKNYSENYFIVR